MPQIFKDKEETVKKAIIKTDVKIDTTRTFSSIEMLGAMKKLDNIYAIDDRIGFVLRLLKNGIKDKSYHIAIISELKKLLEELQTIANESDLNKELYNRCIDTIKRVIKTNTWPIGYEELIKILSEFRIKMYVIEERSLSVLNEQFKRLISEYPELYPDIPIEYDSKDEDNVRSISFTEFANIMDLSYKMLKNIEMEKYDEAKKVMENLRQILDNLFNDSESEDPKNIIGYAKFLLTLFSKASNDKIKKGIDVIKISIVFQLVIRMFIIRFKIDYPGDSERVKARQDMYRS